MKGTLLASLGRGSFKLNLISYLLLNTIIVCRANQYIFDHRGHRGAARYTEKLLALLLHFSVNSVFSVVITMS